MSSINTETDTLIPINRLAQQRLGKRVSPATLWRWLHHGCRGVRLEAVQVMGVWHTTPAAFGAFIRGQTAAAYASVGSGHDGDAAPAERSAATQKKLVAAGLL